MVEVELWVGREVAIRFVWGQRMMTVDESVLIWALAPVRMFEQHGLGQHVEGPGGKDPLRVQDLCRALRED